MNTPRTREAEERIALAQRLNPRNYDDAEYMLAHRAGFDAETLAIAEATSDAYWAKSENA